MYSHPTDGTHILQAIREYDAIDAFPVSEFVPGGSAQLAKTLRYVHQNWPSQTVMLQQWDEFASHCPTTDNVDDYMKVYNVHYS